MATPMDSLVRHPALQRVPNTPEIVYDNDNHAFYRDGKVVPGLTKQIETLFFHPQFHRMSHCGRTSKLTEQTGMAGSKVGRTVDKELMMWTSDFHRKAKQAAFNRNLSIGDAREQFHPYTKALIKFFVETVKWAPIACQVVVGDACGCATKIDMVMENERGEVILVEIKAGYNHTFKGNWSLDTRTTHPEKWLTDDLNHIRADALSFAMIEICWGELLFCRTFVKKPVASYVVHVHDADFGVDAEVEAFGTLPWITTAVSRIIEYMNQERENLLQRPKSKKKEQYAKDMRKDARDRVKQIKELEKELKAKKRELKTALVKERQEKKEEAKAAAREFEEVTRRLEELKSERIETRKATRRPPAPPKSVSTRARSKYRRKPRSGSKRPTQRTREVASTSSVRNRKPGGSRVKHQSSNQQTTLPSFGFPVPTFHNKPHGEVHTFVHNGQPGVMFFPAQTPGNSSSSSAFPTLRV